MGAQGGKIRERILEITALSLFLVLIELLVSRGAPGWRVINIDNEKFLLSALVQVDASLFAIVVSLTLIMAEIISTNYSVDLLDILFKDRRMRQLIVLYGVAIFMGVFVLKFISTTYVSDFLVFFSILLSIVAFESLWHYMQAARELVHPYRLATSLVERLPVEDMLNDFRLDRAGMEHFSPIESFVHGVIAKGDLKTLALTLNRLASRVLASGFWGAGMGFRDLHNILSNFSSRFLRIFLYASTYSNVPAMSIVVLSFQRIAEKVLRASSSPGWTRRERLLLADTAFLVLCKMLESGGSRSPTVSRQIREAVNSLLEATGEKPVEDVGAFCSFRSSSS